MRIFDETKTNELTEYDLEKGYLKADILTTQIPEVVAVTVEQKAKELTAEGKEVVEINGILYEVVSKNEFGQTVSRIVETPAIPAHDKVEDIGVYIPYTEEELEKMSARSEIAELKANLSATDYKAIKYAEGAMTEEEYAETKAQRQAWRDRINELEAKL